MHEIYERCATRKHGSFMPHGAIFKTTRDILKVGDIWRYCVSALELQNAETKRVAKTGGSCRQQMSSTGQTRRSGRTDTMEGVVTANIGYATTQCISTLRKLLGASQLRRGDGVIAFADSRIAAARSGCCKSAAPNWPPNGSNLRCSRMTTNHAWTRV